MSRYENLGALAVRWLGLAFLSLSVVSLLVGLVGPWTMGGMMGGRMGGQGMTELQEQMMPGSFGHMAQGGFGMWWGPTVLFLVMGLLLIVLGRPLGSALASGLTDREEGTD
ncbi:MAG: hypothetical protein U5R14_02800 [Gemmatimonadota bacterium]|nr:hypothetical protein [Gemmatimonadota bacterium]